MAAPTQPPTPPDSGAPPTPSSPVADPHPAPPSSRDNPATPATGDAPALPSDTPPPGPGHLAPLPDESEDDHRAFLLWAMQAEQYRSNRLTAKAVGVTEITIRRKRSRFKWDARARNSGSATADVLAWREYLDRYAVKYQLQGVGTIQANMSLPGPESPLRILQRLVAGFDQDLTRESAIKMAYQGARELTEEFLGRSPYHSDLDEEEEEGEGEAGATPDGPEGSTGGSKRGASPRGAGGLEDPSSVASRRHSWIQRYNVLIEGTLGVYASQVKDKKIKVAPGDLKDLIALHQQLQGFTGEDSGKNAGPMESVRVRIARETGGDLLGAIEEDHEEMGIMLEAIRAKQTQDAEHLRREIEIARDRGGAVIALPQGRGSVGATDPAPG